MAKSSEQINSLLDREYQHGFTTDIEVDTFAPGLDEEVIRRLSAVKGEPEFLLEWRLKAYQHWLTMSPPNGLVCIIHQWIFRVFLIIQRQK